MLASPRTEPIRKSEEVRFVDGVQHLHRCAQNDLVLQRRDAERSQPPASLGDVYPTHRLGPVCSLLQPMGEVLDIGVKGLAVVPPRLAVHARRGFAFQTEIGRTPRFQVTSSRSHLMQQFSRLPKSL